MITLLLATAYSVNFPGGAPNDFVTALAEGTKQNVVLSQGQAAKIAPAQFETTDLDLMARTLRTQTEHAIMPGTDLVISDQLLAKGLVANVTFRGIATSSGAAETIAVAAKIEEFEQRRVANRPPTPGAMPVNFVGLPTSALKDGKITFKTEKTDGIQLRMLDGQLSKPVKVHWIFEETPVFVQVKDMPELDFMKWVAKAVGSRLVAAGKEYSFELDPVEIRKRAVATINRFYIPATPTEPAMRRQSQILAAQQAGKFRIACLNALSPGQVTEALATNGGSTRIELAARGALTNLAVARVREIDQAQTQPTQPNQPPNANQPGILQRVDPNRSAFLIVDSKLNIRIEVPVVDSNGRPAGVVNVQ